METIFMFEGFTYTAALSATGLSIRRAVPERKPLTTPHVDLVAAAIKALKVPL